MAAKRKYIYFEFSDSVAQLQHRRFGHAGHTQIKQAAIIITELNIRTNKIIDSENSYETSKEIKDFHGIEKIYESCVLLRQIKIIYYEKMILITEKLDYVHLDFQKSRKPVFFNKNLYAAGFTD